MTPYYDDGTCVIYHGDCRDLIPRLAADLVLTDPPYGVGVRYGGEFDDFREDYWEWFAGMVEIMRDAAPVVVFTHRVTALQHLLGWQWVGVWHKPLSAGVRVGNSPVLPHWEPIFMYGIHSLGTKREMFSDVWSQNPIRVGNGALRGREGWARVDTSGHPTPKPPKLYGALVRAFSDEGATVLDPFMGSGTTLREAKDLGRRAIGIEIEERYCEIAAKRLSQEVLLLAEPQVQA